MIDYPERKRVKICISLELKKYIYGTLIGFTSTGFNSQAIVELDDGTFETTNIINAQVIPSQRIGRKG